MCVPAEVFCLVELLVDEMDERGWTTEDIAVRMGTSRGLEKDLLIIDLIFAVSPVKDGLIIDEETFDGLARAFDVDPDFFRNLDKAWRQHPDRRRQFTAPERIFSELSRNAIRLPH